MAETSITGVGEGGSLISRRHPKFFEYASEWAFFLGSYIGGPEYTNSNLFQYFKEGDREFYSRKTRAYRENHTKRVVDLINSYLFQEEPIRKFESDILDRFLKNIDGRGKKIDRFMKRASVFSSILGRVYIVIDKRPLPEDSITGTQRDNLRPETQPYCYLVYPQDVCDISFDDMGKIRWALIRERQRDDEDPFNYDGLVRDVFRLWLPNGWRLYDDGGRLIDFSDQGVGTVPIVVLENEEKDEYAGLSLISDVAYLDRAIMNNWSRLDVIVNDQTFSQLIFPIEGLPADIMEDEELRKKFMVLATNRVLLYSAQAQAAPSFISPDASQGAFILNMLATQVKQLYASIGLQSETATETQSSASGVSKAFDFQKLNKLLANKADNLEQAEVEIVEIFKKLMGNIVVDFECDYPEEFDVRSLVDEINIAQQLTLLGISDTFTKELHKNIAHKVMPKADKKIFDIIDGEIDARNISEEVAATQSVFPFDQSKKDNKQTQEEEVIK